jgi:hypothetical protein
VNENWLCSFRVHVCNYTGCIDALQSVLAQCSMIFIEFDNNHE